MASQIPTPELAALVPMQRKLQAFNQEFRSVEEQISVLRMRGAYLQEESTRLELSLARGFEQVAQAQCRKLCDDIVRTLPQEIRDILYTHLLSSYHVIEKKRPALFPDSALTRMVPRLAELLEEHFVQPSYVGDTFQSEIVAQFYRRATLRIVDPGRIPEGHTHVLRHEEPFGSGRVLGSCLRNIEFRLSFGGMDDLWRSSLVDGLQNVAAVAGPGCRVIVYFEEKQVDKEMEMEDLKEYVGVVWEKLEGAGVRIGIRQGQRVWDGTNWREEGRN